VDDKGPIQAYHPINQQKTPNQWIPFTFNWNLRANMTLPQISWLFLIPIKKHPSFERLRKNNNNKKKRTHNFTPSQSSVLLTVFFIIFSRISYGVEAEFLSRLDPSLCFDSFECCT
jgi:hypothetical protein